MKKKKKIDKKYMKIYKKKLKRLIKLYKPSKMGKKIYMAKKYRLYKCNLYLIKVYVNKYLKVMQNYELFTKWIINLSIQKSSVKVSLSWT